VMAHCVILGHFPVLSLNSLSNVYPLSFLGKQREVNWEKGHQRLRGQKKSRATSSKSPSCP